MWLRCISGSPKRHRPARARGPLYGRKLIMEKLWQEFFSDPSQWWDHRSAKANPRYPDFKHKMTKQSLWLIDNSNPPWVEAELAAMPPGTLQSNIFPWNVRLQRYVQAGYYKKALDLFQQTQQEGMIPDKFTFLPVLNACSELLAIEQGRQIHSQIRKGGLECDVFVGSCLVDMYAKCGSVEDAWRVFSRIPKRDVITWNAMILGYVKSGQGRKALELYRLMQRDGVDPDPVTLFGVLNACAATAALGEGRRAHRRIIERGYESDARVESSLVDMYAKCGRLEDAREVFDNMLNRDVVAWSAMILAYVKCGQGWEALELGRQMERERIDSNPVTLVGLLNACAIVEVLEEGRRAHKQIVDKGYESNVYVANSLIDMYAKCGSLEDARRVFNKMPIRDVVSWNAMIFGCVKCGEGQKALELSEWMQIECVDKNLVTFVGLLKACASVAALEEGRHIHGQIIGRGYDSDIYVASSLVDMYAKCGSLEDAKRVFSRIPTRDVVAWSAMLAGYGAHGYSREVLECFEQMSQGRVEVNEVTFVSLLSACSHGGLVEEGMHYLESMIALFHIYPTVEHYVCVIDTLGRAGRLHEAEDLIKIMPCKPDASVWMSLLGACRAHGNVELGEYGANQLLESDPGNVAGYVLLSNLYAATGYSDRLQAVNRERLERGVQQIQGRSWIEMKNKVHLFGVDDSKHPQIVEIHSEIDRLSRQMKEAGYLPDTGTVEGENFH